MPGYSSYYDDSLLGPFRPSREEFRNGIYKHTQRNILCGYFDLDRVEEYRVVLYDNSLYDPDVARDRWLSDVPSAALRSQSVRLENARFNDGSLRADGATFLPRDLQDNTLVTSVLIYMVMPDPTRIIRRRTIYPLVGFTDVPFVIPWGGNLELRWDDRDVFTL